MSVLAITGGTGFVGSHLLEAALASGDTVRALTRRPQSPRGGVVWIDGALDRADSLAALVAGADAVVNVAGLVNAADRAGFAAGNIAGTQAIVAATAAAGVSRFLQVSSLAAREPALSDYGWSKAGGDAAVTASGLDWTIVRPPAIFGPRDLEMLELFRFARRRLVPLPPAGGRMSVIAVEDLARLLVTLATGGALIGETIEPDDGRPGGWPPAAFARAIGRAVGTRIVPLPLPRPFLLAAAAADRAVRGSAAKLTADRVRYFTHRDWASHRPPPPDVWHARDDTPAALARTARWYREHGLL